MTEIKTDELARNAALHEIADIIETTPYDLTEDGVGDSRDTAMGISGAVVDQHTVTYERDVNSAGVAVRRIVLRGEWTVDPEISGAVAKPVEPVRRALNMVFDEVADHLDGTADLVRRSDVLNTIRAVADNVGVIL